MAMASIQGATARASEPKGRILDGMLDRMSVLEGRLNERCGQIETHLIRMVPSQPKATPGDSAASANSAVHAAVDFQSKMELIEVRLTGLEHAALRLAGYADALDAIG